MGDWTRTPVLPKAREESRKSVAIVGSGPAGLSCLSCPETGPQVTIFEAEKMLRDVETGNPGLSPAPDVLDNSVQMILDMGIETRTVPFGEKNTWKALIL
jgi:NADPH-dependent glutamate synthase beta subunit-like oxidoreductase